MDAIDLVSLSYSYQDGTPALRNVSFRIEAGSRVALIGPNGAGKSTLLLHLNGILPDDGQGSRAVRIFGDAITRDRLREVRQQVGVVFQDPNDQLFCATVGEDVAFGPEQLGLSREEVRLRVREALSQVGLQGFEHRAPHHLSGGEKRRVCLAGVLACRPGILIFDEPTNNLDPRGRREFKQLLRTLSVTQVIATHDLELVAEVCDRALLMDDGTIVADGPACELLGDEELMLAHGLEKPHVLKHLHPHG